MDTAVLAVIIALASLVLIPCLVLMCGCVSLQLPPENSIGSFLRAQRRRGDSNGESQDVVVFLGDSHTHGRFGFSFVDAVRSRMGGVVVNAGLNGRHAAGGLCQVGKVLACEPGKVVVLLGTNDCLTEATGQNLPRYRDAVRELARSDNEALREVGKELPDKPTVAGFTLVMRTLLRLLVGKGEKRRQLVVINLPTITEVVGPGARVNELVRTYNSALDAVVGELEPGTAQLVRLFEWQCARRGADPEGAAERLGGDVPLGPMMESGLRHCILRHDWDTISRKIVGRTGLQGPLNTVDNIHMNGESGQFIASQVIACLMSS